MAQIHWLNPISGSFTNASDWSGGAVPGANDDAILDAPGSAPYTVTVATSQAVNSIQTAVTATLAIAGVGTELSTFQNAADINAGSILVGDGATFTFGESLNNTGTIQLGGAGDPTTLLSQGSMLSGGGKIILSDSASNIIEGSASFKSFYNLDNTISGAGQLGNGTLFFVNESAGVIDASAAKNPLVLTFGPLGDGGRLENFGLVEATGAGGLLIKNTSVFQFGGVISAAKGATVSLQSASIEAGTLSGLGVFATVDTRSVLNGLTALTNDSYIQINDNTALTLLGTIVNAGTITLASAGHDTDLITSINAATLTGGGSIVMGGGLSRLYGQTNNAILTNVDNTVSGSGSIGMGALTVVNEAAGVIDANGTQGIALNTQGVTLTNGGLIEATGLGNLKIFNTVLNQSSGGSIFAASGTRVYLRNADVMGGSVKSAGTGAAIVATKGGNELNGLASPVTVAGAVSIFDGAALTIEGTIDNTGAITLAANTHATVLTVGLKNATLVGGGTLVLVNRSLNSIGGSASYPIQTSTLTNMDNRILGAGVLGDAKLILVNDAKGIIVGGDTLSLTIDTGPNTIVNAGEIAGAGSGGTTINSAVDNTGVLAAAHGNLTVNGAVTGAGRGSINGAILDFTSSFSENVAFANSPSATGTLELAQSQSYAGTVSNFSHTGGTSLDLQDIGFVSSTEATFSGTASGGVLTVTDGAHTAHINLAGDYRASTFTASSDGHGGTIVVDPAAAFATAAHRFIAAAASLGAGGGASVSMAHEVWRPSHPVLVAPRAAMA